MLENSLKGAVITLNAKKYQYQGYHAGADCTVVLRYPGVSLVHRKAVSWSADGVCTKFLKHLLQLMFVCRYL